MKAMLTVMSLICIAITTGCGRSSLKSEGVHTTAVAKNLSHPVNSFLFQGTYGVRFDAPVSAEENAAAIAQSLTYMNLVDDGQGNRFYISNNQSTKKALLFTGLGGSETDYLQPPQNHIVQGLIDQGFQVIASDISFRPPLTREFLYQNNGQDYKAYVAAKVKAELDLIRQVSGAWTELTYGGVSFGGYHALMASCTVPLNASYFAIVPVIRPEVLWNEDKLPSYDLDKGILDHNCRDILQFKRGVFAYGTLDIRVDFTLTENFTSMYKVKGNTIMLEFTNLDHRTTNYTIDKVLQSLNTNVFRLSDEIE